MLNVAFIMVVNDQYLLKLSLGLFQTFWLHDASARAQKYFQVLGFGLEKKCFFLEVSVLTLDHQNLTPSLVDNKIENFNVAALDCE